MPAALDGIRPALASSDLAWLATQEDVESRLVFTESKGGETRYRVKHGPFQNEVLSSLPRQNWTLLVQDVEKHLPDLRALLAVADFVPDWRIDDLMVSFAAPGGSVGPHRDNYDVFLCQGEGRREWHLGTEEDAVVDDSSGELSLLKPFVDREPQTAAAGDVLYLPPGVPHWGIAREFSMTYSIGMRAPSLAELSAAAARLFDDANDVTLKSSATGADVFYEDPDLEPDEAEPGFISDAAIRRAKKLMRNNPPLEDSRIAMTLGAAVTDPKAWLAPEAVTDDQAHDVIETLHTGRILGVHGMARLAYCDGGGSNLVFANGYTHEVGSASLAIFRDICSNRTASAELLCANDASELTHWLLTSGVFDLTEAPV
jgi:50S ribosomal protein L16 3-hydroxylase